MLLMLSDVNTCRDKKSWLSLEPQPWRREEKPGPRLAECMFTSCSSDIVTRCLKCSSSSCGVFMNSIEKVRNVELMLRDEHVNVVLNLGSILLIAYGRTNLKGYRNIFTLTLNILAVLMLGHAVATRNVRSSTLSGESWVSVCS